MSKQHTVADRGRQRSGFSLMELAAAVAILGVIAALSVLRFSGPRADANVNTCHAHKGEIELQSQLWFRNNGSFPAANLSDIGTNTAYFPESVPTCPVDNTAYTIDTVTGRVVGHTH